MIRPNMCPYSSAFPERKTSEFELLFGSTRRFAKKPARSNSGPAGPRPPKGTGVPVISMKSKQFWFRLLVVLSIVFFHGTAFCQVTLVDMVPATRSGDTNQDSEPTLSVNPSNFLQIVGAAFTWDNLTGGPMTGANAPIYVSVDGGLTWSVVNNVPSAIGALFPTADITSWFSGSTVGTTNVLYTGILHAPERSMRVYRTTDYRTATPMTQLDVRTNNVDQPHTQARTVVNAGTANDRVYVGFNNGWGGVASQTATVDFSLDAGAASPAFALRLIESRGTGLGGQDGFAIMPAIHDDGTIYAAFFGWRSLGTMDIVVVRDDNWASGATQFANLVDAGDANVGARVVTGRTIPTGTLGQQRVGSSSLSIAVDPRNSDRVYVAWLDLVGSTPTLHIRRSTDRGVNWSTADLLTVSNAVNPALAINSVGKVGFLYQMVTGSGANQRWQTQFRRTTDADAIAWDGGITLADTPASTPVFTFQPYIGDYDYVTAVGRDFYGIFSANNFPNLANFSPGVTYQRYVNWVTNTLFADAAMTIPVAASIDPFFFIAHEPQPEIQVPGDVNVTDTCLGASSAGTLNVCNTGKIDLIVDAITSSNPTVSVTAPSANYPVTISPDFCFPFQVVFAPSTTGSQSAILTIPSNDPDTPNTNINVSGNGTNPDIRVTGSTEFSVGSAWKPAEKIVKVCNTGACNLSAISAAISCADFTLINNPLPATISHDFCLDVVVAYTPTLPGSHTCQLSITSNDPSNPTVTRTLHARTPAFLSLHAGLAHPHGTFANTVKNGSTVNVDFLYPFKPNWAWDIRGGISRFDGKPGHPDISAWQLSPNIKFTVNPADAVRLFFNGSLGIYHFDPGNFEAGGNIGAGVNIPVGHRFALEGTYNYHAAFTASPVVKYSQFQLGLLVSF
jgi:hypothetical protein